MAVQPAHSTSLSAVFVIMKAQLQTRHFLEAGINRAAGWREAFFCAFVKPVDFAAAVVGVEYVLQLSVTLVVLLLYSSSCSVVVVVVVVVV